MGKELGKLKNLLLFQGGDSWAYFKQNEFFQFEEVVFRVNIPYLQ